MDSDSLARHYDRVSWLYDLLDWTFERFRYRHLRPGLVKNLQGEVLEAGVGTGRNLPYYPSGCRVTGIDLSKAQLARAKKRSREARCQVRLLRMDATQLDFPDQSFDACLSTFLFCVLPDELQLPALRELLRVTKPGGLLRLLEYRLSDIPRRRFLMRLSAPYVEAVFHARFDRPTEQALTQSNAQVERRWFLSGDALVGYDLRA